jgi:hypothetical protein
LANQGVKLKALERWREEMPTEQEMLPRDKYTMFDRKEKRYRKGIHSTLNSRCKQEEWDTMLTVTPELPKWTRVSQRVNPPGY